MQETQKHSNTTLHPFFIGLFTLAVTAFLGVGIAFVTGAITPAQVLAHVGAQPLAYLYLSQIPYTGLELGTGGTILYWFVLICAALALAHTTLFKAIPLMSRSVSELGSRVSVALNAPGAVPVAAIMPSAPSKIPFAAVPEAPRGHSPYEGFKSFARDGALSIDDIVKGLSRHHPAPSAPRNIEPILNVEPVYENVEPIAAVTTEEQRAPHAPVRGLASALLGGDRAAVFAGLRQHTLGGGRAEELLSEVACLLDDAYRARIDGTASDADIARLSARLSTPTLEKLVAALATAVDSSYSVGVTGAKLALIRALAVLGA